MLINMKENGMLIRKSEMEEDFKSGQMVQSMRATGKVIRLMEEED